jgi:hypothetical protein
MRNRNRLLAHAILIFVFLQFLPATAVAGDPEFHALVERVSAYYQKRPMRGMGLLSFIANRFTPQGVGHFQMAIFDDITSPRTALREELESSLQGLVGPDYQPFVRAQDNRGGDLTIIYIRESGKQSFEMLIISIDSSDAVLMKMRLRPEAMREWMDEPVERGKGSSHHGGSSAGK